MRQTTERLQVICHFFLPFQYLATIYLSWRHHRPGHLDCHRHRHRLPLQHQRTHLELCTTSRRRWANASCPKYMCIFPHQARIFCGSAENKKPESTTASSHLSQRLSRGLRGSSGLGPTRYERFFLSNPKVCVECLDGKVPRSPNVESPFSTACTIRTHSLYAQSRWSSGPEAQEWILCVSHIQHTLAKELSDATSRHPPCRNLLSKKGKQG